MAHHPDCQRFIDRLEQHLRVAGFCEATVLSYCRALRDVQQYFHTEADAITTEQLLEFLAKRQREVGSSTLNIICCGLKYFYGQVLGDHERVVDMPIARKSKQLGDFLTAAEICQLIKAAGSLRHRLVIELLFGLGLRAGEIGGLRIGDFDKTNQTVRIRKSKGGNERILPYGDRIRSTLRAYYQHYLPDDYLIPAGYRGKNPGIAVRGVQYIVRKTLIRSGLRKKVCPHSLRHSFAVHYLNNGGSLLRLKQLLGHKCMSTTLLYLRYASIPLRNICSPLDHIYVSG
ncbi:MAG: tyrosine-type recombinase/integrase [Bacteroidota bacterium]